MKEKQRAKLLESCRLMQGSSKARLFRSGAANEESDGFARYSEKSWPLANWVAPRAVLVPCGMGAFLFTASSLRQFGWYRENGWLVPKPGCHPYFLAENYERKK